MVTKTAINMVEVDMNDLNKCEVNISIMYKGWLAIAKLTPLSLFISLLLMPNKAFDNVKIEK